MFFEGGFGKSECGTWFFAGEVVVIRWHNVEVKCIVFGDEKCATFLK
jgi:hypothetical protein